MSKTPVHKHNYVLKKETTKWNNVYRFYECVNRSTPCPKRDKMTITRRKDLPGGEQGK